VERFNTVAAPAEAAQAAIEARLQQDVRWHPAAAAAREDLPAFARGTAGTFVAGTVFWRGRTVVEKADLAILDQAFGTTPQPLSPPLVALHGPLNFALANNRQARGGFSRAPLEARPPLRPDASAYPPLLVGGLPPPDLAFVYPPHLELVNDGYAIGLRWIREEPTAFAGLVLRKLRFFLDGATLGVTGRGFPLGTRGVRRAVDLTVPADGITAWAWRAAVLAVLVAGLRQAPLWLLFAVFRVLVAAAFFGYARHGALLVPLVAIAAGRLLSRVPLWAIACAATLLIAVEAERALNPPTILVDGVTVLNVEPAEESLHRDEDVDVR
jgi:hypothetical protein